MGMIRTNDYLLCYLNHSSFSLIDIHYFNVPQKNHYPSSINQFLPASFNPTIICLASINTVEIIMRKLISKCRVLLKEKQ